MATFYDETRGIELSDDEARGGVTGHNVRYVLALGMTGVIAAFAAIPLYYGFDRFSERIATAFAQSPMDLVRYFGPYAMIVLGGAIGTGLLLGLWNVLAGRSDDGSQLFMRFRVAAQFALIVVIMAILYVSGT